MARVRSGKVEAGTFQRIARGIARVESLPESVGATQGLGRSPMLRVVIAELTSTLEREGTATATVLKWNGSAFESTSESIDVIDARILADDETVASGLHLIAVNLFGVFWPLVIECA